MSTRRLFVYGSLLSGEPNAHHLAGARALGPAATIAGFSLLDLRGYPGLRQGGSTSVKGELYLADEDLVGRLDEFEGHPELFVRTPIALAGGGAAEAYLLAPGQFPGAPIIPGGDWRRHRARHQPGVRRG
jgi:gamma-glutamylaminecyclotransferase